MGLAQARSELEWEPPKRLGRALRYGHALKLPARLLPDLPVPPVLLLHVPGVPGVVRVELDPARARAARELGELVVDAGEWLAIATAAEADRLWPADFVALSGRKRSEPGFVIDLEMALAGAQPDPDEAWSAAEVLDRIGAEVLSIDLE